MEIGAFLEPSTGGADPCGSYAILKHWYWQSSAQAPKPSRTEMENFRGGFQTHYQRDRPYPPGLTLDTYVELEKVNN